MSSLNVQILSRYFCSSRNALLVAKSSNWISVPGNTFCTARTNSAMSWSYSLPRSRGCLSPMYSGSSSSCWLFVPTSMVIGSAYAGCTPAHAVYRDNLPIGMPMPSAPRSPRPRMRSPSVTTMIATSFAGQFRRILAIRPRSLAVM